MSTCLRQQRVETKSEKLPCKCNIENHDSCWALTKPQVAARRGRCVRWWSWERGEIKAITCTGTRSKIAEPGQESQIARQAASGRGKISNDWKHGQCVGIVESCAATHPCRTHDTLISMWGWGPAPMAGQAALRLLTAFSKFYWKLRLDLTLVYPALYCGTTLWYCSIKQFQ